ncbi:NAD(P)-binding Rossmann-fold containing protein [Glarea lozoyensis ATCC 20868]|uniref:NAD(P)-binding Rossmann-fold containing protein n=1 Tax=Glarea lozoyensis (strain ATCC 20868 / MF5171) TaxID=1116229 RepID=S3D0D1_GLAL2|nr:NAD(P)-binding Rossmann-fold containing protein [Glarea lozoyensis ATCC 20868]EPE31987.1 NAD(P)-binding Rossmann-fold containing protein [Glarea lozoyensis ATCC 20868]
MSGELILITGTTGFVGFAVLQKALQAGYKTRIAVRKESQIGQLKSHRLIKDFAAKGFVEGVVVPDIGAEGAFDEALKDVVGVLHIASPLGRPNIEDTENELVKPAVNGSLSILKSGLKFPQLRRIVITSSAVAIMTDQVIDAANPPIVYTANTRVSPLPTAPFPNDPWAGYRIAKQLALDATEKFIAEKKPQYTVVNLMPGYVFGRNELAEKAQDLLDGSNAIVLGTVLGAIQGAKREGFTTPVTDLARIHVEALGEKVKGNQSFLLLAGKEGDKAEFNRANEIAKTEFADAVAEGILNPVGSTEAVHQQVDKSITTEIFGPLETYEDGARAVIAQYVELKRKEASK